MFSFNEILKNKNVLEFYFAGKSPGIMAYHGGAIEKGTEQIARAIISHGFAGYIVSARARNNHWSFHVGSQHIKPNDSEKLRTFISCVDSAIAIDGQARDNNIYVGGLNTELRCKIAEALSEEFLGVVSDLKKIPSNLRGISKINIVNKPEYKGVQIELPKNLRVSDGDYDKPADWNGKKICNAILKAITTG